MPRRSPVGPTWRWSISDGTPSLYLNGKFARTGLKGKKTVHSGVGVSHGRELKAFRGQVAGLQQFRHGAVRRRRLPNSPKPSRPLPRCEQGPAVDLVGLRDFAKRQLCDRHGGRQDPPGGRVRFAGAGGNRRVHGKCVSRRDAALRRRWCWTTWSHGANTRDDGVKYFSGAATYRKSFDFTPVAALPPAADSRVVYLDLGKVAVMAAVKLNGKDLGVLWKPPYRVDITDAVKAGANLLEVRVVNLPINRMLGDELLPEDSERNGNGTLKTMAAVVAGWQTQPERPLHLHQLAAVEEGRTAPGVRLARPGDRPHRGQDRFAVNINHGIHRTDSKNLKNSERLTSSVGS